MTEPLGAVLERVASTPRAIADPDGVVSAMRCALDRAAAEATATLHDDLLPLRVPKDVLAKVLACEQHLVEMQGVDELTEPAVRGRILDRLLHHHVHGGGARATDPLTIAEDAFEAERDDEILAWLAERDHARDRLADDACAAAEHIASLGALDGRWWPRCESRLRVDLAAGRVVCSAQLDLVVGGAPTGLPMVVFEAKSGPFAQDHRHGLFWYAVLASLRFGRPPAAVIGWSGWDGSAWCQPVTEPILASATERAVDAIGRLGELVAGRTPRRTATRACGWCPARSSCDAADTFAADDA